MTPKTAKIVIVLVIVAFTAVALWNDSDEQPDKWYEGGTLHQSTIGEWHDATAQNKLATVGDFVAGTTESGQLRKISSADLKQASAAVVTCIDEATKGVEELMNQNISTFSIMCMTMLKQNYPYFLTK